MNGTRMVVKRMHRNLIETEVIIAGKTNSQTVLIPRIELMPSDPTMPFMMKRRQFPIRLSFAMTINKSQGQTFDKIGIYLRSLVFTYGQLYVSFSRVKSFHDVTVEIVKSSVQGDFNCKYYTSNVVYKEIL